MTDELAHPNAIGERVRACLDQYVGTGGHPDGYTIDPEAFEVTDRTPSNGSTGYAFRVDGRRDDEFTEAGDAERYAIEGTVVLVDDDVSAGDQAAFVTAVNDIARAVDTDHDLEVVDGALQTTRAVFRRTGEGTP